MGFSRRLQGNDFFEELADMMPCHHQKSSIRNQMIRITLFDHYRTEKSYHIKTWLIKKAKIGNFKSCKQSTCTMTHKLWCITYACKDYRICMFFTWQKPFYPKNIITPDRCIQIKISNRFSHLDRDRSATIKIIILNFENMSKDMRKNVRNNRSSFVGLKINR